MNHILPPITDTTLLAPDAHAGFGVLETDQGRLPLVALDVQAKISDLHAETLVRQTFRNSLAVPLEATYIFPLPDRAAVTRFQMRVAGRTIDGDLKERGQAREEYDRAIQTGHRAAIAEEERSGVFTLRVGNLPPHEEATVELTLVGPLPVSDGKATFRFPLVVAPRYTPGIPLDGPSVGSGVESDTDQVPDASRVSPPVLLTGFPNPVRLALSVEFVGIPALAGEARGDRLKAELQRVRSSLHSVLVEDGDRRIVRLQPGERLDRDFILRFPVAQAAIVTSLKASPAGEQAGVFALTILPPAGRSTAWSHKPREVVFVLDRSGSMRGWKMVAARRALGRMIDSLLDQDRFTVIAFDSVIERPPHVAQGLADGSNRERWQMLEWLGKIDARGGTELGPAVEEALVLFEKCTHLAPRDETPLAEREEYTNAERILVLITDGQVSGEDVVLKRLQKTAKGSLPRIFTVGIDRAVNAGFLQRLATLGHGDCELVESEERLDAAMDRIHRLVATPVLTQVAVEPLDADVIAAEQAPVRVSDLFVDRPVTIYGRHLCKNAKLRFRLHGVDAEGKAWSEDVAAEAGPPSLLKSVWGRARVRDLEDEYAAGSARDNQQLMKRIVAVSLEAHVLSRFTAYVAVDRSEIVNAGGVQHEIVQPVEMPSGWGMTSPASAMCMSAPAGGMAKMKRSASYRARSLAPEGTFFEAFQVPAVDPPVADDDSVDSLMCEFTDTAIEFTEATSDLAAEVYDAKSPVAKLIDVILKEALRRQATEVHLQPQVNGLQVSYLIEGKLVEYDAPPLRLYRSILSRIRILAGMSTSDNAGQLKLNIDGTELTIDVAITSSPCGETVVLRLPPAAVAADNARRDKFWT